MCFKKRRIYMQVYEIGQFFGVGSFPADQFMITSTIKEILDKVRKKGEGHVEDYVNELFIIAPFIWRGQRKFGGRNFCDPKRMDRLEELQSRYPDVTLCSGVYPRLKGNAAGQIFWHRRIQSASGTAFVMGAEEDLPRLKEGLQIEVWENPPRHPEPVPQRGCWFGPQVPDGW
jgi:hypothetical protein